MLRKLLVKILPIHKHKIVSIDWANERGGLGVYKITMDCSVQPEKIVLVKRELVEGESFDPHFSNPEVIARFQPTDGGYWIANELLYILAK